MSVLAILLIIIVAGILLWLCNRFIPMDGTVKMIFNVVCVLILIVFLLKAFGVGGWLNSVHV